MPGDKPEAKPDLTPEDLRIRIGPSDLENFGRELREPPSGLDAPNFRELQLNDNVTLRADWDSSGRGFTLRLVVKLK